MKPGVIDSLAAGLIGAALVAAVAVPVWFESSRREAQDQEVRTLELTGVMGQGVWTDEAVTAASAWRSDFRRARPVLEVGKTVRLRLASADVVHGFAIPGLGIDRVEVYPGERVELLVTPRETGSFEYYCTTVCGAPHFAMRGFLDVVSGDSAPADLDPEPPGAGYWLAAGPPGDAGLVARGAWLYRQQGCVTCHGEDRNGGTVNLNSMNKSVPAVADLARRLFLFSASDIDAFSDLLAGGPPLEDIREDPRVPLFPVVKRQYLATRDLVRTGRLASLLDPDGPRPPLDMPAWGARLADVDIDAILAYLLTAGLTDSAVPAAVADQNNPHGDSR